MSSAITSSYLLVFALLATTIAVASGDLGAPLWTREIAGGVPKTINNRVVGDYLMVKTANWSIDVYHAWSGNLMGRMSMPSSYEADTVAATKEFVCYLNMNYVSCMRFSDGTVTIKEKSVTMSDVMHSIHIDDNNGGFVTVVGDTSAIVMRLSDGAVVVKADGDSAAVGGGAVYVTRGNELIKVDISTGKQIWSQKEASQITLQCASSDTIAAKSSSDIMGFSPSTGKQQFSIQNSEGIQNAQCIGSILLFDTMFSHEVYVVNASNAVHQKLILSKTSTSNVILDVANGQIINLASSGPHEGSPFVEALSLQNEKTLWRHDTPVTPQASISNKLPAMAPLAIVGSYVAVPSILGCNFFDLQTGALPGSETPLGRARFAFFHGANVVAGLDSTTNKMFLVNFADSSSDAAVLSAYAL